jgi:hypothetical protein
MILGIACGEASYGPVKQDGLLNGMRVDAVEESVKCRCHQMDIRPCLSIILRVSVFYEPKGGMAVNALGRTIGIEGNDFSRPILDHCVAHVATTVTGLVINM